MNPSYKQGSYLAAPYAFESAKNPETEQLRALTGLKTLYSFDAGAMEANEVVGWQMLTDILVKAFWVRYPTSPSGTLTLTLYDPLNLQQNSLMISQENDLVINTDNNGEKLENAWSYRFPAPFAIPKGWYVRLEPSVAIAAVMGYGEPCLFINSQSAVRIT